MKCQSPLSWEGPWSPPRGCEQRSWLRETKLPFGGRVLSDPHSSCLCVLGPLSGNGHFLNTYYVPGPTLPAGRRRAARAAPATMP